MTYAVINLTNYGTGYVQVGTFRSERRAKMMATRLDKSSSDNNSYHVIHLRALDNYTDESIFDQYAHTRICDDCGNDVKMIDGRYYKYEDAVWLCDDCHDHRMDEDDE